MLRFLANRLKFTIEEIDYIASHIDKNSFYFKNLSPKDPDYEKRFYFIELHEKMFPTYNQASNWLIGNIVKELKDLKERVLKLELAKRKLETEKI
ncbi:MAG TPA: hypothetical protein VGB37_05230 [Candidatus Lokiarchaeia archaeon]